MFGRLINRIGLFSLRREEPYPYLKRILGVTPKNKTLYRDALRHKSVTFVSKKRIGDNERLEFLGDAVLSVIVTEIIFSQYPKMSEGEMTELRSRIVNRATLNQKGEELGLSSLIEKTPHIDLNESNNIIGNALEAIIGALYLDYGYAKTKKFVARSICTQALLADKENQILDYKSAVINWCQKNKYGYKFSMLKDDVDEQNRHQFNIELTIKHLCTCYGSGTTKKEAEQRAAQDAFAEIVLSKEQ